MFRRKFLLLFVGISVFVAGYLYYVKQERLRSIEEYFDQPKVGDIYKIEKDYDDGRFVEYWKVTQTDERGLVFAASKIKSWGSVDYLQKHFDEMLPFSLTHEELKAIKEGKWDNYLHDNTRLIEIMRK
jgi:hypothetical protein